MIDNLFREAAKRFPDCEIGNHIKSVEDGTENFEKATVTLALTNINQGKHKTYNSEQDKNDANKFLDRYTLSGG